MDLEKEIKILEEILGEKLSEEQIENLKKENGDQDDKK